MLPEPKSQRITLLLTPSEERALAALAARRGASRPTMLRELIKIADLQRQIEDVTKRPTQHNNVTKPAANAIR